MDIHVNADPGAIIAVCSVLGLAILGRILRAIPSLGSRKSKPKSDEQALGPAGRGAP